MAQDESIEYQKIIEQNTYVLQTKMLSVSNRRHFCRENAHIVKHI